MEPQSILTLIQKSSELLIKLLQQHVNGTSFGPSTAIVLPTSAASIQIWMKILLHSPTAQMKSLGCSVPGPLTSKITLNSPIPSPLQILLLRDTLSYLCTVQISVPSFLTNRLPLQNFCQFMAIVPSTSPKQLLQLPYLLSTVMPHSYWIHMFSIHIPPSVQLLRASTMPQSYLRIRYINPSNAPLLRTPKIIWQFPFVVFYFLKHIST